MPPLCCPHYECHPLGYHETYPEDETFDYLRTNKGVPADL
jgi:hypothetical protein